MKIDEQGRAVLAGAIEQAQVWLGMQIHKETGQEELDVWPAKRLANAVADILEAGGPNQPASDTTEMRKMVFG